MLNRWPDLTNIWDLAIICQSAALGIEIKFTSENMLTVIRRRMESTYLCHFWRRSRAQWKLLKRMQEHAVLLHARSRRRRRSNRGITIILLFYSISLLLYKKDVSTCTEFSELGLNPKLIISLNFGILTPTSISYSIFKNSVGVHSEHSKNPTNIHFCMCTA
jgi:hypothetical protein